MRKGRSIILAALLAAGLAHAEGDAAAGREKSRMCAGCHGIGDYRTAYPVVYPVPRIGGQEPDYIAKVLKDYRSGARKSLQMQGIAAQLSDRDIDDIAAFYSAGAPK